MSDAKIFLLGDGYQNLVPMTTTPYATEEVLQGLLARYPDLLPGDQIDPDDPRRWLPVSREMGVPGAERETGRWSLDHLLLDQDATTTFVECKRASDTRGRREVVAQMPSVRSSAGILAGSGGMNPDLRREPGDRRSV